MVVGTRVILRNHLRFGTPVYGKVKEITDKLFTVELDNENGYTVSFDINSYKGIGRFNKWTIEGIIKD